MFTIQILGSGMSNRMWENTVEHAKTCVLGEKLYIYYSNATHSAGVVFNHIYELQGLITDGQFLPLESLHHNQKVSYLHSEIPAVSYSTAYVFSLKHNLPNGNKLTILVFKYLKT